MSLLRLLFPLLATGDARFRRRLDKLPFTRMDALAATRVCKVQGTVEAAVPQRSFAMLSGTECVGWRTAIDVATHGREGGWMHLVDKFECVAFLISDGEHQVRVNGGEHFRLVGPMSADRGDSMVASNLDGLAGVLASSRFGFASWADGYAFTGSSGRTHGIRVRETILALGAKVIASAAFRAEPVSDARRATGGYREHSVELVADGSRRRPVLVALAAPS